MSLKSKSVRFFHGRYTFYLKIPIYFRYPTIYLNEINILKEKLNNKKALIEELIETLRNLTPNILKHHPIKWKSFTSDSDEKHHISTVRPVND